MTATKLIEFLRQHPEAEITFREPYDEGNDLDVTEVVYDYETEKFILL